MSVLKDLGKVTAYAYAKAAGYTGTEEQFQAVFDDFTENAPGLISRLDTAVSTAEDAKNTAVNAKTAAQSAQTAAENAAATFTTDTTLAVSGKAADAKATGDAIAALDADDIAYDSTATYTSGTIGAETTTLKNAFTELDTNDNLLLDMIPDTEQTITFDASGNVSTIIHASGATTIRTDSFTFGDSSITETRTLNTGDVLTIVTDLSTLATTVTQSN